MVIEMVKKEDIKQEFNLFADVWNTYKALLPARPRNDTRYWGKAVEAVSKIMRKYPGQFSKDLSLAILGDLERRSRDEDQNTGCETVS